jgi:hypothetical protein
VKAVPTLRMVSTTDTRRAVGQLNVQLPTEVQLALADIAGMARGGVLAMSVATGLAVIQTMFDAEISAACEPKCRHDAERTAVRHGRETNSVVLGGRRGGFGYNYSIY